LRCCKGAGYLFFGKKVSAALVVHAESVKIGPKDGSVPVIWGCHFGKTKEVSEQSPASVGGQGWFGALSEVKYLLLGLSLSLIP
jgi:hypothetical protein